MPARRFPALTARPRFSAIAVVSAAPLLAASCGRDEPKPPTQEAVEQSWKRTDQVVQPALALSGLCRTIGPSAPDITQEQIRQEFTANQKDDPTGFKTPKLVLGQDDMGVFKQTWAAFVLRRRLP